MNRIFTFVIILMALTACAAPQTQATVEPTATDMPQAGLPNPASVYCEQNGNTLDMPTPDDGSESGVCVFPDGNICDEWAYLRGECGSRQVAGAELSYGELRALLRRLGDDPRMPACDVLVLDINLPGRSGLDVLQVLKDLFVDRGLPDHIRSDNGPEFVSRAILQWLLAAGIDTALIDPGKPWQNGTDESFNGKFHDEA